MALILQHLTPFTPASDSEAGASACFLADLGDHESQGVVAFLRDGNTKRRWWVNSALPNGIADTVQLDPEYSRAGEAEINVPAILAEVDDLENNGSILVKERQSQSFLLTDGYACPPTLTDPFEVAHGGGSVWFVSAGEFRVFDADGRLTQTFKVPAAQFTGTAGFIGFRINVRPYVENTQYPYIVEDCGRCEFLISWKSEPPTLILPAEGDLFQTDPRWKPGYIWCPLAYVSAPTDTRPATIQLIQGGQNNRFDRVFWGNPLPPSIIPAQ